jgi:hypothetical protein
MRGSQPGERRGGRAKGIPNKASAKRAEAVAASGLTPLDYMLDLMREGAERGNFENNQINQTKSK